MAWDGATAGEANIGPPVASDLGGTDWADGGSVDVM